MADLATLEKTVAKLAGDVSIATAKIDTIFERLALLTQQDGSFMKNNVAVDKSMAALEKRIKAVEADVKKALSK